MAETVIEIDRLTKTYWLGLRRRAVHAVKTLSLSVSRGSIVAFVGPNGAGKTTTIHTLLGFLKPSDGTVRILDEPPGPAVLRRVGYQPEIFQTYPFYSARQALTYYGRLSGLAAHALDRAIPPLLERMALQEAGNRRLATFSKGMLQRLGLAQAILHDPELLILDEPTSGLDPEGRRLVLDIIQEEKVKGRTVFLSSHILSDVERTCDEVVMIRQGEVAFSNQISAFGVDSQQWEIEVLGWSAEIKEQLGACAFHVDRAVDDSVVLVCDAPAKKALLHTLTSLPVEVGTVRRRRGATLEDTYLKHVGRT